MDNNTNYLRFIIDHCPTGIALIDKDGNILETNDAITKILELPNLKAINIFSSPYLLPSTFLSNIKSVFSENKSVSQYNFHLTINSNSIYVNYYITPVSHDNTVTHVLVYITDITVNEENTTVLSELYNTIIENFHEGIVIFDEKCRVLYANKTFRTCFELTDQNIIGKELNSLIPIPHSDKINGYLSKLKNNFSTFQFEFEYSNKKNERKFFLHEIYAIHEKDNPLYFIVIFHDITEQRKKENTLLKSKNKAERETLIKSSFIANISHELRTPLNAIIGFAGLLNNPALSDEKKHQYIQQINASTSLISRIIDDLIDLSKIETGNLTFIYDTAFLFPFFKEIYEQYSHDLEIRNKKHISFILDNSPQDDIPLYTDKLRLKQIISNLLLNAIKYTFQGEIHIGYKPYSNSVIFYVQDTGMGIKKEDIPHLFIPFTQIKNKYIKTQDGSGLGLSIVKKIVEQMNGSIHVESEWMKGSTFSVRFPLIKTTLCQKPVPNIPSTINNLSEKKITILIAEDDEINCMFLEEMLSEYSFNLIIAHNGREAVSLFKEHAETIDIVLMDIQMPDIDGFTATRLIKETNPAVPVIAQTAFAYSTEQELSKKAGCVDYLVKPIQQEELINKIAQYIVR